MIKTAAFRLSQQKNDNNNYKPNIINNLNNIQIMNHFKNSREKNSQSGSKSISENDDNNIIIYDEAPENNSRIEYNEDVNYPRSNTLENLTQHKVLPINEHYILRSFSLDDNNKNQLNTIDNEKLIIMI